ncbi:hypothetical protein DSO57_1020998 [Entomophthora muscae]|uniref:Uncharacterized protein n=1 Tax=Entomophthora muscae TaxID=34485 RepID=A0ACC2RIC9_9FUNG|nr:hypothetical protein DSO57_1020998 [Entomophthora muscae]
MAKVGGWVGRIQPRDQVTLISKGWWELEVQARSWGSNEISAAIGAASDFKKILLEKILWGSFPYTLGLQQPKKGMIMANAAIISSSLPRPLLSDSPSSGESEITKKDGDGRPFAFQIFRFF